MACKCFKASHKSRTKGLGAMDFEGDGIGGYFHVDVPLDGEFLG